MQNLRQTKVSIDTFVELLRFGSSGVITTSAEAEFRIQS